MNLEQFRTKLKSIDDHLDVLTDIDGKPKLVIYQDFDEMGSILYNFEEKIFDPIVANKLHISDRLLDQFHEFITNFVNDNRFKQYTDRLANVLLSKNNAYGDSFSKSLDEDGLLVLKIRLGDKFNRISSLIKRDELKENDESLEDTLLDLAGYSILGLKYLEEHKDE